MGSCSTFVGQAPRLPSLVGRATARESAFPSTGGDSRGGLASWWHRPALDPFVGQASRLSVCIRSPPVPLHRRGFKGWVPVPPLRPLGSSSSVLRRCASSEFFSELSSIIQIPEIPHPKLRRAAGGILIPLHHRLRFHLAGNYVKVRVVLSDNRCGRRLFDALRQHPNGKCA